jgi:hypothetical protein
MSPPHLSVTVALVLAEIVLCGLADVDAQHPAGERLRRPVTFGVAEATLSVGAADADHEAYECSERQTADD